MEGLGQPWTLLARRLADLEIRTRGFGGIYIATGRVKRPGSPAARPH